MFGFDLIDAGLLPAMAIALIAGLLSFLSPCVLPIVPPYLAYMGGISMSEMRGDQKARRGGIPAQDQKDREKGHGQSHDRAQEIPQDPFSG